METYYNMQDGINTYWEYPYHQLWGLPGLYPFAQSVYKGFWETDMIVFKIYKSIQLLKDSSTFEYIDNTILLRERHNDLNPFLDTAYWDKFRNLPRMTRAVENHFVWNHYNSETIFNLRAYYLWTNLYPYNVNPDIWDVKSPIWSPKGPLMGPNYFYGFSTISYDINYVPPRTLLHHDDQVDIYLASNLFWQTYESNGHNLKGFFLFWYEPYGSVEIGLNFGFHVWYNSEYPTIEDETFQCMNMFGYNDYGADIGPFTDRSYLMTTEMNDQIYDKHPWIMGEPIILSTE